MQNLIEKYNALFSTFVDLSKKPALEQNNKEIQNIESYIDQTLLKPDAKLEQFKLLFESAKKFKFKTICIPPQFIKWAHEELQGHETLPITVIGFPLGYNTTEIKVAETFQAIADGAKEIDMVININLLKSNRPQDVLKDIYLVKKACQNIPLKVIIETSYLNIDEKIMACACVEAAGADFIKTSTGFSSSGANLADIKLFKQLLKDRVKIKASGGIKNNEDCVSYILAGADRIGTSSGEDIILNKDIKTNGGY